jgi:hypothetical protein
MRRASLCAAVVTALGLSKREHMRRKYAPSADLLLRSAAAASRKTCAARFTQRLVLALRTLPPLARVGSRGWTVYCSSMLRGTRGQREAEPVARADLNRLAALRSAGEHRSVRPAGFVP